ncbi:MAG: glycosyltransferase family 9 protein [Psychroflexus sp.]
MTKHQHLLIIRLSAMGDVAMTVPVIEALLQQNPDIKVTVVSKAFFCQLFHHLPNVKTVEVDTKKKHKGVVGLWRLAQTLHQLKPTHVADFHNVLRSKIVCGFLKILGHDYVKIDKGRKAKKRLTRTQNKVFLKLKSTHCRYADVLEKLGFYIDFNAFYLNHQLPIDQQVKEELDVDFSKKLIGIAPFAAHEPKQYPLALMQEVIESLQNKNYQILLFGGGKNEVIKLKELENKFSGCTSVAGKFSFVQELQIISNLDLMISMDSGNGHLAAMFGVRVVTIWGATHPYAGFSPFNQKRIQQILPDLERYPLLPTSVYGNKMIEGYENVMSSIDPKEIIETAEEELI